MGNQKGLCDAKSPIYSTGEYVLVAQSCKGSDSCKRVKCCELNSDQTRPAPAGAALAAGGAGGHRPRSGCSSQGSLGCSLKTQLLDLDQKNGRTEGVFI